MKAAAKLLAVLAAALAIATLGVPATANQLDATAWWSVSNAGPISVPAPPDVADDDLLIQGVASPSGLPDADPLNQAVAAVSFTLAADEEPGPLVLPLKQAAAMPPSVKACRITASFQPVKNGAWSEVPRHDCGDAVTGSPSLDNTSIAFADTSRFVNGNRLAMLLVPEGPTRVVLAPPTSGALLVTNRTALPVDTPPVLPADANAPAPVADVGVPAPAGPAAMTTPVQPQVAAPPTPSPAVVAPQASTSPAGSTSVSFPTDSFTAKLATAGVLFLFLAPLALRGQFKRRPAAAVSSSQV